MWTNHNLKLSDSPSFIWHVPARGFWWLYTTNPKRQKYPPNVSMIQHKQYRQALVKRLWYKRVSKAALPKKKKKAKRDVKLAAQNRKVWVYCNTDVTREVEIALPLHMHNVSLFLWLFWVFMANETLKTLNRGEGFISVWKTCALRHCCLSTEALNLFVKAHKDVKWQRLIKKKE